MSVSENNERQVETRAPGMSRRSFFEHASLAGTATALGLFSLAGTVRALADQPNTGHDRLKGANAISSDVDILSAAAIAEALAVATYTGIVRDSGWFTRIPDDDQGYFKAARNEEMSHYLLATSAT